MPGPSSATRTTHRAPVVLGAGGPGLLGERHRHPGVARGVHQRVRDEVAHHLAQPRLVAEHHRQLGHRRVQDELQRPVRLHRRASWTTSPATSARSTGRDGQRPLLVQARQLQQVLDQHPHPAALGLDALHEPARRRRRRGRRPAGTARRSRGSRSAGCAARGWRRRRTGASGPRRRGPAPRTRAGREKALSIRASIPLSAADSRPTSVRSSPAGTRRERSPAAMACAVRSTSASGRRLLRTSMYPAAPRTARTTSPTNSSMRTSRPMAFWSPSRSAPTTRV